MRRMKRPPGLINDLALQLVTHTIGAVGLGAVLVTVLVLAGLGWFTDALFEWLTELDTETVAVHRWIGVAFFPLAVTVLIVLARRSGRTISVRVDEDTRPPKVRGLILYLSTVREEDLVALREWRPTALADAQQRAKLGRIAWRMPVEAVAYHLERLRAVAVIPSADLDERSGSVRQAADFADLIARCCTGRNVDVVLPATFSKARYRGGVDFEDVQAVAEVTEDAYQWLASRRIPTADVLVDVTGGQKTNTVAGAAVALAEGRRMQYVSTRDYQVRVYDVTYKAAHS